MDVGSVLLFLFGLLLGVAGGFAAGRRAGDIRVATATAERDHAVRERELLRRSEETARERAALAEADVAGMRTALDYERRSAVERLSLVEQSQQRLAESFQALSARALESASRQFLELASIRLQEAGAHAAGELEQRRIAVEHLVSPLREVLGKMEHRLADLETARVEAYATLVEQVRGVQQASEGLRTQTAALVTALRKPQTRGAWGEMQLRRVAEVAGMIARCDFTEQPTVTGDEGVRRPDMVVHLAGNRNIIVDAKVPLVAFLEATEAPDEAARDERLGAHARHLRAHVDALGAKAYWRQFSTSPEFVVLFVPAEAFLAPALEKDPALLEHAAGKKVIIATPTTLIAMLRTVAHAWTQEALTTRSQEIFELGRDLYTRLGTLGEHVDRLGRSLGRAVTDFNAAVGSLESRVLVPARRLAAMEVVDTVLPTPSRVEAGVRALSATELVGSAEEPPVTRSA
ncbi:DNA recombination protein RmuC [Frankia sp. Cr2]|uniref:DNA recombination protein RmuC n=1 Tax=Frankia sp. Cr2 TaxID=3073932 RepID=UPI002AD54755|nr:DNA recombination protein RmuC [Frankia sp. Cr2]